jgi:APA family basic amino acid/polyamine antiporter
LAKQELKKSLTTFQLILYGTGTIVGAGIYVLVGKVAGIAGIFTPISFLLAATTALFTGLSYAQLASYFPKSAGEVIYVKKAFGIKSISQIIGWMVLISGSITAAVLIKGFAGYLQTLIHINDFIIIATLLVLMGGIAIKGISESVWLVGIITIIEIAGLCFIILLFHKDLNMKWLHQIQLTAFSLGNLNAVILGSFLAFFAFIGFEDLANVAEEAKQPKKSMPIAIIGSILISTALYIGIAIICINVLPQNILKVSKAPLATLLATKGANYAHLISIISMIAVVNGLMVQIIMGSRVLYGMATQKLAPLFLEKVNRQLQTPINAILTIMAIIFLFSVGISLVNLAELASFLILLVFCMVNLSLIRLKTNSTFTKNKIRLPQLFPWIGFLLSLLMLLYKVMLTLF